MFPPSSLQLLLTTPLAMLRRDLLEAKRVADAADPPNSVGVHLEVA